MTKEYVGGRMRDLQLFICDELEKLDGKAHFEEDAWDREQGGGGYTRVIAGGDLIEKGGVAFSAVHGPIGEEMKRLHNMSGNSFYATGVSIVLHPRNPHVPIIHMNVRYFEMDNGVSWFGGGIDLTPHYIVPGKAKEFHSDLEEICNKYDPEFYSKFSHWADEYFYLPHRGETRGIGGIFYDHLSDHPSLTKEQLLEFGQDLGKAFPFIYGRQAQEFRNQPASEREISWRNHRRGRYVEFNLVHDRGTKFGLHSGGRTESILMSLPPDASWTYNQAVEPGSREAQTLGWLKGGRSSFLQP